MKKQSLLILMSFLVVIGALFLLLFPFKKNQLSNTEDDALPIASSFYLYEDLLKEIGGDNVRIVSSAPRGTNIHDIEPSAKDIATLSSARLFIIAGAGLDPWAEKIAPSLREKGITTIIMEERVPFDIQNENDKTPDPHTWLDPLFLIKEVDALRDVLIDNDNINTEDYRANTKRLQQRLKTLHEEFTAGLAQCAKRDVIVSHNAFAYLGRQYNITFHSITGVTPEAEASAQRLRTLIDLAREKNISIILTEPLETDTLSQTLAAEIGAETAILHPLEGLTLAEQQRGENYFTIMQKNLSVLRDAMQCL